MKLLFDENISYRIVKKIQEVFPESQHVTDVRPLLKGDMKIFEYARDNDFTLVTFDEDFVDIQSLKNYPPKVLWLRMGNSSTLNVLHRLSESKQSIIDFADNVELGVLEIY